MFLPNFASNLLVVCAVWRPVVRLSAAGEVGFTVSRRDPQVLFSQKQNFSQKKPKNQTITTSYNKKISQHITQNHPQHHRNTTQIIPNMTNTSLIHRQHTRFRQI